MSFPNAKTQEGPFALAEGPSTNGTVFKLVVEDFSRRAR